MSRWWFPTIPIMPSHRFFKTHFSISPSSRFLDFHFLHLAIPICPIPHFSNLGYCHISLSRSLMYLATCTHLDLAVAVIWGQQIRSKPQGQALRGGYEVFNPLPMLDPRDFCHLQGTVGEEYKRGSHMKVWGPLILDMRVMSTPQGVVLVMCSLAVGKQWVEEVNDDGDVQSCCDKEFVCLREARNESV